MNSTSEFKWGWTVGAGVEWMFAPGWSARGEYLHVDLGKINSAMPPLVYTHGSYGFAGGPAVIGTASSARFTDDVIRIGVNYHF